MSIWRKLYHFYNHVEWIFCVPFRLAYQGNWSDHPKYGKKDFVHVYGPLFNAYSPVSKWGYLYGVLLLIEKLLTLWVIGGTVKPSINPSGNASVQLFGLAFIRVSTMYFILDNSPFNEGTENAFQFVVAACQGCFFMLLGLQQGGFVGGSPTL